VLMLLFLDKIRSLFMVVLVVLVSFLILNIIEVHKYIKLCVFSGVIEVVSLFMMLFSLWNIVASL